MFLVFTFKDFSFYFSCHAPLILLRLFFLAKQMFTSLLLSSPYCAIPFRFLSLSSVTLVFLSLFPISLFHLLTILRFNFIVHTVFAILFL